jgi:cytochrome d ubiquinol oxidase subunit II
MFSFEAFINLPMIWGGLIGTAVLLYILLDGFDLGVGILFPFAPSDKCRDRMVNSIAPFWDGNETWLVLGGGGLFAAFPLAYSIVMPALYLPVIFMLLGLIFRGVAFEFRFKSEGPFQRKVWDYAFHFGSLTAAFCQGLILGGIVQGIEVEGRSFAGGPFDWLTSFSVMCGVAVVFGYALLGAAWTIMKSDGDTQQWARRCAKYTTLYVAMFMGIVSLWVPFLDNDISKIWFGPHMPFLMILPLITMAAFAALVWSLVKNKEVMPFLMTLSLFLLGYVGLGISLWPWAVPYEVTLAQAAATPESLSLLLVGITIFLPVVLAYTGYCYYLFRGKTDDAPTY